ncbi:MAG: 6,7-dimethyl-8-ribityllumazine synthase [Candidatus Fermentibacteraceae bacterium]|nr:6,7-dimethyl-8-ribityllumazine synthase [Candidatus Fermentibacteraceae bacterium]MBN2607520.1 6,7-dimethyl-8-ribityllumazine synthase [Candidatus Fermentibacteraceae bacterium]
MTWIHEGKLDGEGLKPAIVVSRFNSFITGKLLDGALDCLERHNVNTDDIDVFWVPGAWEIPALALRVADTGIFDCVICLGAVIRGETPHFEYVSSESAKGVAQAAMLTDVPVIYGVVTADTVEQAVDRAGTKSGNKGFDAAMTALEMTALYDHVSNLESSSEEAPQEEEGD